jgi:thymidylate kinase
MRAAVRARNRGMIVICDRYPQVQTMGFNDGPLLSQWMECGSSPKRRLARWEFETYRRLTLTPPDLVVKLDITPEAATSRKPDTAPEEVARKRLAVRRIDYGPSSETLEIDAMRPLTDIVKKAVWAQL